MPKQDPCCPDPSELRVFRLSYDMGNTLSYTVPAGKVLIINAWMTGIRISNLAFRLLRNTDVVAERVGYLDMFHQEFPTGIAFLAGDTFTIDAGSNVGPSYAYGYERDA